MARIFPWQHDEIEPLQDCKVFRVGRSIATSPTAGTRHPFYRIDAEDWVNVVPLTANDEIVMVRQFRHGAREVTLEIPGGIIDPGEAPEVAAARELIEETGYRAGEVEPIGVVNPNPALFGNAVHTFVARGCEYVTAIQNGETEETAVELIARADLGGRLRAGEINHALVIAALHWFELAERNH